LTIQHRYCFNAAKDRVRLRRAPASNIAMFVKQNFSNFARELKRAAPAAMAREPANSHHFRITRVNGHSSGEMLLPIWPHAAGLFRADCRAPIEQVG